MVKTLPSNAVGTGLIPHQGTKIPYVAQCSQLKKNYYKCTPFVQKVIPET